MESRRSPMLLMGSGGMHAKVDTQKRLNYVRRSFTGLLWGLPISFPQCGSVMICKRIRPSQMLHIWTFVEDMLGLGPHTLVVCRAVSGFFVFLHHLNTSYLLHTQLLRLSSSLLRLRLSPSLNISISDYRPVDFHDLAFLKFMILFVHK